MNKVMLSTKMNKEEINNFFVKILDPEIISHYGKIPGERLAIRNYLYALWESEAGW